MTMVTGLFKHKDSAERAFQSVIDLGYDKSAINMVMSDESRQRYFLDHNSTTVHPGTTGVEEKAVADTSNSASDKLGGPVGGKAVESMSIHERNTAAC